MIGTLGAPLVLRCLAYGWPAPMVKWWRGKTMLPLYSEQYEMRRDNSLLIRSLQISKLGEYICDAYNGQGAPGTWSVKVKALRPFNVPEADERDYGEYLVATHSTSVVVTPRPHVVPESPRVEEPVYEPPTYNGLYGMFMGFLQNNLYILSMISILILVLVFLPSKTITFNFLMTTWVKMKCLINFPHSRTSIDIQSLTV